MQDNPFADGEEEVKNDGEGLTRDDTIPRSQSTSAEDPREISFLNLAHLEAENLFENSIKPLKLGLVILALALVLSFFVNVFLAFHWSSTDRIIQTTGSDTEVGDGPSVIYDVSEGQRKGMFQIIAGTFGCPVGWDTIGVVQTTNYLTSGTIGDSYKFGDDPLFSENNNILENAPFYTIPIEPFLCQKL